MSYDFHPIFVHFPVALLTIYSLLEIVRLPFFTRRTGIFPVKLVMLVIGTLGAAMSLLTGDAAAEAYEGTAKAAIIEWHSTFAFAATILYAIVTLSYVIRWLGSTPLAGWIPQSILQAERKIFGTPVLVLLATLAFLALLATGILGGSLVYGTSGDPLVTPLYKLLGIH